MWVSCPWNWRNQKKRTELKDLILTKAARVSRSLIASVLGMSRAGVYCRNHRLSDRDETLYQRILQVLSVNPSYGHRRIAIALGLGKRRVRRVMRKYHLKPYKRLARWRKRRDERRPPEKFVNLIKGSWPIRPGIIYTSDFTYLRYQDKFLYLATMMDLYTREIVGWDVSLKHTTELVGNALMDAVTSQGCIPKIIHSDQGSEYASQRYIKLAQSLGIQISMSKKSSPWENGYQESFFNNFKTDLGLEFDRFNTIGHFIEAIHQTINYYNQRRIHTSLKTSPVKFRQLHQLKQPECLSTKVNT